MKSCLGTLVLSVIVLAIIITVVYHMSVNSELRFETRDSHVEYINPRRSYRPQNLPHKEQQLPAKLKQEIQDDDVAEEVEP